MKNLMFTLMVTSFIFAGCSDNKVFEVQKPSDEEINEAAADIGWYSVLTDDNRKTLCEAYKLDGREAALSIIFDDPMNNPEGDSWVAIFDKEC